VPKNHAIPRDVWLAASTDFESKVLGEHAVAAANLVNAYLYRARSWQHGVVYERERKPMNRRRAVQLLDFERLLAPQARATQKH